MKHTHRNIGILAAIAQVTLGTIFATDSRASTHFELPTPIQGRLSPAIIAAAAEPTGLERNVPLESCIAPEESHSRSGGGDWCPSIFNQVDTAHYARGTTLIWHILVNHAGGSFERDEIDLVGGRAALAKQYFRDHAPPEAHVRFDHEDGSGFYYYNPTLPYEIDFDDNDPVDADWVNDACMTMGVYDWNGDGNYSDDLSLGLQSWVGWDNVIVVFQAADVWWRANASVARGACQVPPFEDWQVYAHEWGHCFGACDEYEENGGCNGNDCNWICQSCYLTDNVPNGNCEVGPCPSQTCIMKAHLSGGALAPCSYTARNFAWVDADDSGLLDNTTWNRDGNEETMWELYHRGWFIHTNTNWAMVANQTSTSWGAIGVRGRDESTCYDIDVYGDNNHNWHLASSDLATRVNFVVGDFNHNNLGQDHIRLRRKFGNAQYLLNYENGTEMLYPDGRDLSKSWGDREVVRVYDVPLFAGEYLRFDLDILTSDLDLGMALFKSNGDVYYAGRDEAVAAAASNGPGLGESFYYAAPEDDVYGLVVFANSEVDGNWEIQIGPDRRELLDSQPAISGADVTLYYYEPADFYWSVVATRPAPGRNVRIRLFSDSVYSNLLATSGAYPNVEFIAADYNPSYSTDYVRVNQQSGGGYEATEWEHGGDILDGAEIVDFSQYQVAKVWDCYLRDNQRYFFRDYSADVDTGLYLMRSQGGDRYHSRSGAVAGDNGNPIQDGNAFFYTAPETDWYGFVAIKEDEEDSAILVMNGPYYELSEREPVTAPEALVFAEFPETNAWIVAGARAESGLGTSSSWSCGDYRFECSEEQGTNPVEVSFTAIDANHVGGPGGTYFYTYQRNSGSGDASISFDDGAGQTLVYTGPADVAIGSDEMTSGEVVQVWQLDALPGGSTDLEVMVHPLEEDLDLGIAFVSSAEGDYHLDSDGNGGPLNEAGPGRSEYLPVRISVTDTYGIVVTNHGGTAGRYEIVVTEAGGTADTDVASIPTKLGLENIGANPAAGVTRLRLAIPEAGPVEAGVFDVQGRLVRRLAQAELPAGHHELEWDGRNQHGQSVENGVYFVRAGILGRERTLKILRAE